MRMGNIWAPLAKAIAATGTDRHVDCLIDLIGADMGSIDIGPTYLGKGKMATAPGSTRRDLRRVLHAARALDVPMVIGSAGSASGAAISTTSPGSMLPVSVCRGGST